MAWIKAIVCVALVALAAGCVTNPDGSTANIFTDIERVLDDNGASPEQSALREQAERYDDYAEARIASAAAGALLGGIVGLIAGGDTDSALVGAAAGGVAGYVGGSYLTRDHAGFYASQEALNEDIAVAGELTESSRQNVMTARAALAYQKQEVARLEDKYEAGLVEAVAYESALEEIALDRESVRSMIDVTQERLSSMERSIAKYRSAGYDTAALEAAKNAQARDIANLRAIEDAMVAMIAGAPDDIVKPAV